MYAAETNLLHIQYLNVVYIKPYSDIQKELILQ